MSRVFPTARGCVIGTPCGPALLTDVADLHVTATRYVRSMEESLNPIVAGEPLDVLEEALDRMQLQMAPCGCISMHGKLPPDLGQAVERAIRTIEMEMFERGMEPWSSPDQDPFGELLFRIVTARIG